MADFTTTINESLFVYGVEDTNKWGTMLWSDKWAFGNADLLTNYYQVLDDSGAVNTISLSDSVSDLSVFKVISETMTFADEFNEIHLKDAAGFSYTFTLPTDDIEDQASTSYSVVSEPSTSWSSSAEPSTTWSES